METRRQIIWRLSPDSEKNKSWKSGILYKEDSTIKCLNLSIIEANGSLQYKKLAFDMGIRLHLSGLASRISEYKTV